ncbi:MAG: hypothetical protein AB1797_12505 [bacterium]
MKTIEVTISEEIISLVGSEEEFRKEAKEAFILDLHAYSLNPHRSSKYHGKDGKKFDNSLGCL